MPKKDRRETDIRSPASEQESVRLREENERITGDCKALREALSRAEKDVEQLNDIVGRLIRGADSILRSRSWKLAHFLGSLKYRLLFRPVPLMAMDHIRKVKAKYDQWLSNAGLSPLLTGVQPERPLQSKKRLKVTVIGGDVSNNSLGRAYLLAEVLASEFDVGVAGPVHSVVGDPIWEPLKKARLPIHYFEADGENYLRYFNILKKISEHIDGDIIYISKPRMPSLILAALVKQKRNVPLVLDIDDHELSFFKNRSSLALQKIKSLSGKAELGCLHGETWTRYADSLVKHFDQVTVSNAALQKKYGGTVIPHLRDETEFKPADPATRAKIRNEFGYKDSDKVILFVGTPRWHKGLGDIIRALDKLGDPSFNLCVIGTNRDEGLKRRLKAKSNVKLVGNTSFFDLPRYLQLADLICILQDPASPVSQYQMPAKFTDALSMGIPIIAYDVPPLRPYHESGLVEFVRRESLPQKLVEVFGNYEKFKDRAVRNIEFFNKEFSYEAGREKLIKIFDEAVKANRPLHNEFGELIGFITDSCKART